MTDAGLGLGSYLLDTAELVAITLPLVYVATRLRAHLLPTWTKAPARLAEATLALSLILVTSQILGAVGLFHPAALIPASLLIAVALPAITRRVLPRVAAGGVPANSREMPVSQAVGGVPADRTRGQAIPHPGEPAPRPAERTRGQTASPPGEPTQRPRGQPDSHPGRQYQRLAFTTAAIAAALLAATWAIPTAASYAQGITGVDSMWYHLPQSAKFVQTGSVVDLQFTDPYFLNWFYPANSELLHALGMLAYDRDWLSPAINHGFLALGLLGAWCIGRPWGVGPVAMVAAAVVFGSEMMLDFQPGEARNDAAGLALVLAAVGLLVTGPHRALPVLAFAGLAAGLALGTKLSLLAPVAALMVAVPVALDRGERLRGAAVFAAATLAAGGFWYLRNVVHSGNPLPWIDQVGPLSLPAPEVALELRPPFSVAHYATDFGVWRDWLLPGLADSIGPLWPAVLGLVVVGAAVALLRAERLLAAIAGVVLVTLVAYVFTPLTASGPEGAPEGFVWNLRYIAPALGLGLALLPALPPLRGPRARLAVLAILFALLLAQTLSLEVWDEGQRAWALGSAVLTLALFGVGGWFVRRQALRPLTAPVLAAAAVALVAAALAAGWFEQDRYMEKRYTNVLAGLHLDQPIAWADRISNAEIATAGRGGVFFQYGFYGADLSNRVQWVGAPGPRGAWLPIGTCESWRDAVNRGGYEFVVTTYDRRFPAADETSREREWIRRDPAAREVLSDGPAAVYRLSGPLDPSRCGAAERAAADRPTGVARRDD